MNAHLWLLVSVTAWVWGLHCAEESWKVSFPNPVLLLFPALSPLLFSVYHYAEVLHQCSLSWGTGNSSVVLCTVVSALPMLFGLLFWFLFFSVHLRCFLFSYPCLPSPDPLIYPLNQTCSFLAFAKNTSVCFPPLLHKLLQNLLVFLCITHWRAKVIFPAIMLEWMFRLKSITSPLKASCCWPLWIIMFANLLLAVSASFFPLSFP